MTNRIFFCFHHIARNGLPYTSALVDMLINCNINHNLPSDFCLHFPQCSLIVTSDVSNLSSNRLRSIQKYQTPVVGVDYVYSCLERGVLLPVDEYKLDTSSLSPFSSPLPLFPLMPSPLSYQGIILIGSNCFQKAHRY